MGRQHALLRLIHPFSARDIRHIVFKVQVVRLVELKRALVEVGHLKMKFTTNANQLVAFKHRRTLKSANQNVIIDACTAGKFSKANSALVTLRFENFVQFHYLTPFSTFFRTPIDYLSFLELQEHFPNFSTFSRTSRAVVLRFIEMLIGAEMEQRAWQKQSER